VGNIVITINMIAGAYLILLPVILWALAGNIELKMKVREE